MVSTVNKKYLILEHLFFIHIPLNNYYVYCNMQEVIFVLKHYAM